MIPFIKHIISRFSSQLFSPHIFGEIPIVYCCPLINTIATQNLITTVLYKIYRLIIPSITRPNDGPLWSIHHVLCSSINYATPQSKRITTSEQSPNPKQGVNNHKRSIYNWLGENCGRIPGTQLGMLRMQIASSFIIIRQIFGTSVAILANSEVSRSRRGWLCVFWPNASHRRKRFCLPPSKRKRDHSAAEQKIRSLWTPNNECGRWEVCCFVWV